MPRAVERCLAAFLKEQHGKATRPRLDDAVAQLSEAFTAERGHLPGSYLNLPPVRSAYLAHFHPQQILRGMAGIGEALHQARARALRPGTVPLRVADLGAGLGAMSQALLCHLADEGDEPWPELALVDHQRSAVAEARALTLAVAEALRPGAAAPRVRCAVTRIAPWRQRARRAGWRFDVVLLGAVLNEQRDDWAPLMHGVAEVLAPGGVVVVVEPALDETARRLMELREGLREAVTTLAPCTHDGPCPLLARRRDWCFTVRAVRLPRDVRRRAELLGHQSAELRYALWAFCRGHVGETRTGPPARVVSDPMGREQVLCAAEGELRVRPLAGARRGDLAVPFSELGGSRGSARS